MKIKLAAAKKAQTCETVSKPAGRCRDAVLGFSASIRASMRRLKDMAADRADIMHMTTATNLAVTKAGVRLTALLGVAMAKTQAISANGKANTVWLKRINSKKRRNNPFVANCCDATDA